MVPIIIGVTKITEVGMNKIKESDARPRIKNKQSNSETQLQKTNVEPQQKHHSNNLLTFSQRRVDIIEIVSSKHEQLQKQIILPTQK